MSANTENTLPDYFSFEKSQFTSRLGKEERELAAEYIKNRFPAGAPKTARDFLKAVLSNTAGGEDVIGNLKGEIYRLKEANERMEVQSQVFAAMAKNTDLDFSIFQDERLKGFENYRLAEHQHPFDTLKFLYDEAVKSMRDYEFAMAELHGEPLRVLEGDEYQAFKKWDAQVLTPGLHQITGIAERFEEKTVGGETKMVKVPVFTPRHKFLMMFDYCFADPVAQVLALFPDATPEQIAKLEDMQFPRASVVAQVLQDIAEIDALTQNTANDNSTQDKPVVEQPKETETTEGGRVVALHPTANTNTTADTPGGDGHADGPE